MTKQALKRINVKRVKGKGLVFTYEDINKGLYYIIKWEDSFTRTWYSPCDKDGNSTWLQCATKYDALLYTDLNKPDEFNNN